MTANTPYIEAKKAEVREKLEKAFPHGLYHIHLRTGGTDSVRVDGTGVLVTDKVVVEVETLINTLLDEIESRVAAEFEPNQSEIDLIRSAFQHLRTGETN